MSLRRLPTLNKGRARGGQKARSCERSSFVRYCATSRAAWRSRTIWMPRAVVALVSRSSRVLYVDSSGGGVDVNLATFAQPELGRACAPPRRSIRALAILCSLIFVPIMSLFEKAGWMRLRRLDAPIFYTVFYGPFSAAQEREASCVLARSCRPTSATAVANSERVAASAGAAAEMAHERKST